MSKHESTKRDVRATKIAADYGRAFVSNAVTLCLNIEAQGWTGNYVFVLRHWRYIVLRVPRGVATRIFTPRNPRAQFSPSSFPRFSRRDDDVSDATQKDAGVVEKSFCERLTRKPAKMYNANPRNRHMQQTEN